MARCIVYVILLVLPNIRLSISAYYFNDYDDEDDGCYTYSDIAPAKTRSIRHRNSVSNGSVRLQWQTCRGCGTRCDSLESLAGHMRHECGQVPRFTCSWCTYRTIWTGNLSKHRRTRHPELYREWVLRKRGVAFK